MAAIHIALVVGLLSSTRVQGFDWRCQKEGSCTYDIPSLCDSVQPVCVGPECNPFNGNINGKVLVLSITSWAYSGGPNHPPHPSSAAECCASCRSTPGCNAWTFCAKPDGCGSGCNDSTSDDTKDYPTKFGPFGGCVSPGGPYSQRTCTLKQVADPSNPPLYASDPTNTDWTSGTISGGGGGNASGAAAPASGGAGACSIKTANYNAQVLVLDVNSFSADKPAKVTTPEACCQECKNKPGCNAFTFCPSAQGCGSGCVSTASTPQRLEGPPMDPAQFGPYGRCQGSAYPQYMCTLKHADNPEKPVEYGDGGSWVSGTTA